MIEYMYVGGYSNCINICEFKQGRLKIVSTSEHIKNPSYLHINKGFLYAVCENDNGSIAAFKIIKDKIKLINSKYINEKLPCYLATDKYRNNLLIANYNSGSIIMFELKNNGDIGRQKYKQKYNEAAHIHFADFIGDNIYAIDLGNDMVYVYDDKMNLLSKIKLKKECGPRHLAVSNDEKRIYVVTEYSNEIYTFNVDKNRFDILQCTSTICDKSIESYAGTIKITGDNKYVYVTNRGEDSISVFENNGNDLKMIQNISSYGKFPRDITLNSTEEYILVANQLSNNIVTFKRNTNNGKLSIIENADVEIIRPSCIVRSVYEV